MARRSLGGRLLLEWRKREKLSQGKAAQRCGVPRVQITLYESGKRVPALVNADKIERATGGAVPSSAWLPSGKAA